MGPDSARYMLAGQGHKVARPFNLRWLLPAVCGDDERMWWGVWFAAWPVTVAGMIWWCHAAGLSFWQGVSAAVFVVCLAGVWGPLVVRPVGVDLPAMALTVTAVAAAETGWWPLAAALVVAAAATKETSPIWAALWAWHPAFLAALVVPATVAVFNRAGMDDVTRTGAGGVLLRVHDHPVRTAWEHHQGKWRDPRMVTQWGACLAAFYQPTWQTAAVVAAAYTQLVVATDTYRLVHTAAGPFLAVCAAQTVPTAWLAVAVVVSAVWWLTPDTQ